MKTPEIVTLHVVSFVQPDKVTHRTIEYEKKKLSLVAVEATDRPWNVPYGLKRIPIKEMPKVGGLLGTACVAYSEEQARAVVLRVLEKRLEKTKVDLKCWEKGIELLTP